MKSLIIYIFLLLSYTLLAQVEDKNLPDGNKKYEEKDFYDVSNGKIVLTTTGIDRC